MKNIKKKSLNKNTIKNKGFFKKVSFLAFIFLIGSIILNSSSLKIFDNLSSFTANLLSSNFIKKDKLLANIDKIEDKNTTWPVKKVTHWGKVENYEETTKINWNKLSNDKKTNFPSNVSNIVKNYRFVSPYNLWNSINNPFERKQLIFYKRLLTTLWTASYNCNQSSCDWWVPETGTHAGIDIVSSTGTPVYAALDGIVIKKTSGLKGNEGDGFGNYLVVVTNFNGKAIASFYGHLNKIENDIKVGSIVKQGEKIAGIGNTGNSDTPHLHLQINKLGPIEEVKNIDIAKKLFDGWFHSLEGIKKKTYNPISFIESNMTIKNDSLQEVEENTTTEENKKTNTGNNIIDQISKELKDKDNHTSAPKKDFRIKNIKTTKINNELTINDTIKMEIYTTGTNGNIAITTNNKVLNPSKHIISPKENKSKYNINIKAENTGKGEIIFNDGKNKERKFFKVYEQSSPVFGLKIEGSSTLLTSKKRLYRAFPIDRFGSKANSSLKGNFLVTLINKKNENKDIIIKKQLTGNKSITNFEISAPTISNYKIKVEINNKNLSLEATKNVDSDLFIDYSKKDKYGKSIKELNGKNIIKGHEGKLMPEKGITRAEITTILIRNRFGDNKEKFKKEMKNYINKNGKFFSDIEGWEWYAPYIYKAFENGILKGAEGKSLAEKVATRAELITIYGRYFKISKLELFNNWMDVKEDDWFKKYADAAKSYNLYPFENQKNFNPKKDVNRAKAFESLYRYITHTEDKMHGSSITKKNTSEKDKELEQAVKDLLNN